MGQENAFGLTSLYDPSIGQDELALQRQMQLAQALRAQSIAAGNGTQMAGHVAVRNSPLEGVAKIVQALRANQLDSQNDQGRLALGQKQSAAMAAALRGDQPGPGGAPGAPESVPGAVPPSGGMPAGGRGFDMPSLMRGNIINSVGGPAMGSAYAKNFEPLDINRQLDAAGIKDPVLRQQYIQQHLAKQNYIQPENIRPGGYTRDPATGQVQQFPHVPEGAQAVPDGQGGFKIVPAQGGPEAIAAASRAKAEGPAGFEPLQVWDANANGGQGGMVFRTRRDLGGASAPAQQPQPQVPQELLDLDRKGVKFNATQAPGGPLAVTQVTQPPRAGSGASFAAAPPLGVEKGAEAAASASQKAIDTSWEPLKAQGREAQNTKSYLQQIVQAAEKGAITGPGADRRELIQGMLQLAGIKEEVNSNAVTQTQLLDKYHNQIVARLGQGGLGTDAARSILDTAYPGKQMNIEALREAAGNLAGSQDMTNAKIRFLQDSAIARNSAEYQKRESAFDQNADPRIWQWKNIQNPQQRAAFAKSLMQSDPSIAQRIKVLTDAGAL